MEETKANHGGCRPGSGRKPKPEEEKRQQYQVRALPNEIPLIRAFVKIMREDIEEARAMIEGRKK